MPFRWISIWKNNNKNTDQTLGEGKGWGWRMQLIQENSLYQVFFKKWDLIFKDWRQQKKQQILLKIGK